MKIKTRPFKLVPITEILTNPNNPNKHSDEQIEHLAELLEEQGFRSSLVVSKRSGLLVVGHGRLEAAKRLGAMEVPVEYQDFQDEGQEYAHMVADNAISEYSKLNTRKIEVRIQDLKLTPRKLGLKTKKLGGTPVKGPSMPGPGPRRSSGGVTKLVYACTAIQAMEVTGKLDVIAKEHGLESELDALLFVLKDYQGPKQVKVVKETDGEV